MDITVRKAKLTDVDDILRIAKIKSLKNLEKDDLNNGFLISDFNKEDYVHFIENANFCFVAEKNKEIIGFSISYLSTNSLINDKIKDVLKEHQNKPYIIGKQVACLNGYNAGLRLIKAMIDLADNLPIINAIVLDPYNEKSVQLHEKFGCKKVVEFTPDDGILRGVWRRDVNVL